HESWRSPILAHIGCVLRRPCRTRVFSRKRCRRFRRLRCRQIARHIPHPRPGARGHHRCIREDTAMTYLTVGAANLAHPHALSLPQRQPTRAGSWPGDTEWSPPPDLLEAAREVMGGIDLDPASSDRQQAQATVKAARYFTVENSGLEQPWLGRVWLNPPYARG